MLLVFAWQDVLGRRGVLFVVERRGMQAIFVPAACALRALVRDGGGARAPPRRPLVAVACGGRYSASL